MFVYLGVAGTACENTIATGFYTIRVVTEPDTKIPSAHYLDMNGQTVLENPVTFETRENRVRPDENDPLKVGVTLRSIPEQAGRSGLVILGTCRCIPKSWFRWIVLHTVVV